VRFNSFEFLLFLAVLLALAPLFKGRRRHALLLAASYLFYGSWNPPFLLLLWFSTLLDFVCGGQIGKRKSRGARRAFLAASLVGNLGVLVYFKYGNFFLENVAFVSGIDPDPFYLDVIIPLGISFYTFQSMSYTIDVYRRATEPCQSLLDFALYVTFFPQLIAGPILRVSEFMPQLRRSDPIREQEILRGVELFLLGLFKKVVVADNLAIVADRVFSDPTAYSASAVTIATLAFWVQVYCDFSGYSTMARGLGSLFGFKLPRNFYFPILSHNPLRYRRTWHITMGNWFTDYVYVPLGGSRVGDARFAFNILVTWALLGLWHGASWHFVLWGTYNGILLSVYSVVSRRKTWSLPAFPGKLFFGWIINVLLMLPSGVMFRAESLEDIRTMCLKMVTFGGGRGVEGEWFALLVLLAGIHALCFWFYKEDLLQRVSWPARVAVISATVTLIVTLGATGRPFIYFQF
jgi:D-alanyl-lipoteichoic acid acyltransferase DltB (MBOAT superfamily)